MDIDLHGRTALLSGSRIDEYQIIKPLGAGAFSIVYEAKSLRSGKIVAVKEFYSKNFSQRNAANEIVSKSGHYASKSSLGEGKLTSTKRNKDEDVANQEGHEWSLEKAQKEINVLEKLNHPNIVKYLKSFRKNKTVYLIMEKYNLSPSARFYPHNTRKIEDNFKQILEGVAALHYENFVHRDIKPSNIVWDEEDNPVITDLGMVANVTEDLDEFAVDQSVYSPEDLDESYQFNTDLYSVAAIAYEWLKEKPPLPADREDTQLLVNNCQLHYVINIAMNLDQSKRFSYVTDLLNVLGNQTQVKRIARPKALDVRVFHSKSSAMLTALPDAKADVPISDERVVDDSENQPETTVLKRRRKADADLIEYRADSEIKDASKGKVNSASSLNKGILASIILVLFTSGLFLTNLWFQPQPTNNSTRDLLAGNIGNDTPKPEENIAKPEDDVIKPENTGSSNQPEPAPPKKQNQEQTEKKPEEEVKPEKTKKRKPPVLPFKYISDVKIEPKLITEPLLIHHLKMFLTEEQMMEWEYGRANADCNDKQNNMQPLVVCISPTIVGEFLEQVRLKYQGQGITFRLISPYELDAVNYPLPSSFPKLLTCAYEFGHELYCDNNFNENMQVYEVANGQKKITIVPPDSYGYFQVRLLIVIDEYSEYN